MSSSSTLDFFDNALNAMQPGLSRMMTNVSTNGSGGVFPAAMFQAAFDSAFGKPGQMRAQRKTVGGAVVMSDTIGDGEYGIDVDIVKKKDVYEVVADLPGLVQSDVQLDISDSRVLSISGERKQEQTLSGDGKTNVSISRRYGNFKYEVQLPDDIDLGKVAAKMENGVLRVSVNRIKPEKKKIMIS